MAISPEALKIGIGVYWMQGEMLHAYREAVTDKNMGAELKKIQNQMQKQEMPLQGEHYKRYPRGYSKDDLNAALLLHKGLYTFSEEAHPKEMHSSAFVDYVFARFLKAAPLHRWLVNVANTIEKDRFR